MITIHCKQCGAKLVSPYVPPKCFTCGEDFQRPLWARCVALARISADRGVGDTLDRILWYAGGEIYKRLYLKIRGKKCGCQSRREKLNRLYPYS